MAGAKAGIHVVQLKPILVSKALQDGNKFVKWDEVSESDFSIIPQAIPLNPLS